jgi:transcriptional regulator with PAS, ATPase and Fis domain
MRKVEAAQLRCTADLGTATLGEMVQSYENDLIRQALIASQGSVTRAALLLGISHQRLIYVLKNRHRDLLSVRTPIKPRRRSMKKKRS